MEIHPSCVKRKTLNEKKNRRIEKWMKITQVACLENHAKRPKNSTRSGDNMQF